MPTNISFMLYMKWTRVMLPVVFEEFEMFNIFLLFFSFHYHCQLVKGQLWQKSGGALQPLQGFPCWRDGGLFPPTN